MGKQIEYYIEHEMFLSIAQKALDLGCKIIKNDTWNGKVIVSDSIDIISQDFFFYYFYVPEAGEYIIEESFLIFIILCQGAVIHESRV